MIFKEKMNRNFYNPTGDPVDDSILNAKKKLQKERKLKLLISSPKANYIVAN